MDRQWKKWLKTPINKGQWVVVIHAGGENVFVPNTLLMFKSVSIKGTCHNDINYGNYGKWMTLIFFLNLNNKSVIVIDRCV